MENESIDIEHISYWLISMTANMPLLRAPAAIQGKPMMRAARTILRAGASQ
jgi:hypothetical protein